MFKAWFNSYAILLCQVSLYIDLSKVFRRILGHLDSGRVWWCVLGPLRCPGLCWRSGRAGEGSVPLRCLCRRVPVAVSLSGPKPPRFSPRRDTRPRPGRLHGAPASAAAPPPPPPPAGSGAARQGLRPWRRSARRDTESEPWTWCWGSVSKKMSAWGKPTSSFQRGGSARLVASHPARGPPARRRPGPGHRSVRGGGAAGKRGRRGAGRSWERAAGGGQRRPGARRGRGGGEGQGAAAGRERGWPERGVAAAWRRRRRRRRRRGARGAAAGTGVRGSPAAGRVAAPGPGQERVPRGRRSGRALAAARLPALIKDRGGPQPGPAAPGGSQTWRGAGLRHRPRRSPAGHKGRRGPRRPSRPARAHSTPHLPPARRRRAPRVRVRCAGAAPPRSRAGRAAASAGEGDHGGAGMAPLRHVRPRRSAPLLRRQRVA